MDAIERISGLDSTGAQVVRRTMRGHLMAEAEVEVERRKKSSGFGKVRGIYGEQSTKRSVILV